MKKISLVILLLSFSVGDSYADDGIITYYNQGHDGVSARYQTNPLLNSQIESGQKTLFQSGWYAHRADVTFIKLIQVGDNLGLSVLFSNTGLFCPIDRYLLFQRMPKQANKYVYTVGNGCLATININPAKKSFILSVNSRSKCFEEPTYEEFCNGNLDIKYIDEYGSRYFVNKVFSYAKDQQDNDYDWNDD